MGQHSEGPQAIGSPHGAFRIALDAFARSDAKKVLDCPAGEGAFARMLIDAGHEVTCCDIYPEQFKLAEVPCDLGDLNSALSYEDDTFDGVACLNGLQRVWARGRAVKELARVLKPGGRLVITFPNNADVRRRLLFMMTGTVTWNVIGPPQVCLPDAENPAACFRYPMTLANVLSAIKSVGLECECIRATHYTKGAILLCPLILAPKLLALLAPRRHRDFYYLRESSTNAALLGAFLALVARKPTY